MRLTVRVSPREQAEIARRAGEAQVSVGTFLRLAALGATVAPAKVPEANLRSIGELSRVGNNLNQLVKLIHQGRAPLGLRGVVEALLGLLGSIKAILSGEREGAP